MKKIIICFMLSSLALFAIGCAQNNPAVNQPVINRPDNQTQTEIEQMFAAAREHIAQYSVPGLEFDLKVIKQLDKWALIKAIPKNIEAEEVGIIMEKIDDKWVVRDLGTLFPEWEEKIPELFVK